ncbi:MAG TPA: hypothetical protein VFJ05_06165 [Nitrososphaeraceae archaeon]|nr:hypothetical protein [Nitrososphaeraceae archaeon]
MITFRPALPLHAILPYPTTRRMKFAFSTNTPLRLLASALTRTLARPVFARNLM